MDLEFFLGMIGAITVVLAYGLNSYQILKSESLSYQLLNLFGGIILAWYTYLCGAYFSTGVNVIWFLIATFAIFKIYKNS